jgi:hypothetical protein
VIPTFPIGNVGGDRGIGGRANPTKTAFFVSARILLFPPHKGGIANVASAALS